MSQQLRNQIPDIMERFDFDKVLKVMHFLNWKWRGVPVDMAQIRDCAQQLMHTAVSEFETKPEAAATGTSVATGGFVAEVVVYARAPAVVQLTFYVDQKSGYVE